MIESGDARGTAAPRDLSHRAKSWRFRRERRAAAVLERRPPSLVFDPPTIPCRAAAPAFAMLWPPLHFPLFLPGYVTSPTAYPYIFAPAYPVHVSPPQITWLESRAATGALNRRVDLWVRIPAGPLYRCAQWSRRGRWPFCFVHPLSHHPPPCCLHPPLCPARCSPGPTASPVEPPGSVMALVPGPCLLCPFVLQ